MALMCIMSSCALPRHCRWAMVAWLLGGRILFVVCFRSSKTFHRRVPMLLGEQDLVKTLTEGLMEIGVDGGTVDGGDFIFDEEGRVTGWRR
jgi:hypothetical protein